MKAGIHPEYAAAKITCACGRATETYTTVGEIHVEICSHCHPFFTGKQKLVDTAGRVERFKAKYGESPAGKKKGKKKTEAVVEEAPETAQEEAVEEPVAEAEAEATVEAEEAVEPKAEEAEAEEAVEPKAEEAEAEETTEADS